MSYWDVTFAVGALLVLGLGTSIVWRRQSEPGSSPKGTVLVWLLGSAFALWVLWLGLILAIGDTDFYD